MKDPALPGRIGRYEIEREIGRGTMGVVYRARDPLLNRAIALKVIELAFSVEPEQREVFEKRFFAEAQIAARLSHPNIVVVHDVGRDAETGTLYIALEYLEGRTLAEILKPRLPIEWREALQIARKVAEALHHAHSQRVVHRDVKPGNVMLLPSGEPKIMDFGVARIETARLKLTQAGEFLGTPLYMSPEQALGLKVDRRCDLFALGAIVYEMVTGLLAFGAENLPKIISRVIDEDPAPPSRLATTLPPDVDYIVARALAKTPSDRYPDGRTMADDIADVLAGRVPRHRGSWLRGASLDAEPGATTEPEEIDVEALLAELGAEHGKQPVDFETELATLVSASSAKPAPSPPVTAPRLPGHNERVVTAERPAARQRSSGKLVLLGAAILLVTGGVYLLRRDGRPIAGSPPPATTAPTHARSTPVVPRPEGAGTLGAPPPSPVASPPTRAEAPAEPGGASATPQPARLAFDFEHGLKAGRVRVWVDGELVLEEELDSRVAKKIVVFKKRKGTVEDVLELSAGRHKVEVEVAWDGNSKTKSISGSFKPGVTRHLEAKLGGLLKKQLSLTWR
jgi:serine/threonine-protein kinase